MAYVHDQVIFVWILTIKYRSDLLAYSHWFVISTFFRGNTAISKSPSNDRPFREHSKIAFRGDIE